MSNIVTIQRQIAELDAKKRRLENALEEQQFQAATSRLEREMCYKIYRVTNTNTQQQVRGIESYYGSEAAVRRWSNKATYEVMYVPASQLPALMGKIIY